MASASALAAPLLARKLEPGVSYDTPEWEALLGELDGATPRPSLEDTAARAKAFTWTPSDAAAVPEPHGGRGQRPQLRCQHSAPLGSAAAPLLARLSKLATFDVGLLEVTADDECCAPVKPCAGQHASGKPCATLDSEGHELLSHMRMLWWPELSLTPCFFYFGLRGYAWVPYLLVGFCFFVIGWRKYNALGHVRGIMELGAGLLEKFAADPSQSVPWLAAKGEQLRAVQARELFDADRIPCLEVELPWRKVVRTYLKTLPNCIEMLVSCYATGASWVAWHVHAQGAGGAVEHPQDSWNRSWTPLIGTWLATHSSLPIVLSVLLFVNVSSHTLGFAYESRKAEENLRKLAATERGRDAFIAVRDLFVAVTAAADSANLLLISNVSYAASSSMAGAGGPGRNRTRRFCLKVLIGAAPRLWFKVSAMQHLYYSLHAVGRRATIFSILMVLYSAAEPMLEQITFLNAMPVFYRKGWLDKPDNPTTKMVAANLAFFAASVFFIVASSVRLIGVWQCESHTLQLSTMSCMKV